MGLLVTLGWLALIIGLVLILLGYTVAPQALRPGFGAIVLGVVLIVIGYLIPALTGAGYVAKTDCISSRGENPVTLCTQGDARQSNTSPVPISIAEPYYPFDCDSDWECYALMD